jgi:hypothetical protein
MAIPPNADFNQLTTWLNEYLNDKKSIKACCQEVHKVPETKGIYFWFIHPDGYNALSIKPIEPKYTKVINGVKYDLVYIGTAGVRNNSSGINNGNLKERLKWHLCDNKGVSGLCSGTMSTYRRTLGGLISDDLIANNTQDKIDELLCKYFIIYYVEYPGTFLEVKDKVNSDEDVLIDVIRPILNLDKNPNAKNTKHITFEIQKRRQIVEKDSKKRWCNEKPNKKSQDKKDALTTLAKKNKIEKTIKIPNMEIKDKCFEKIFTNAEDIHQFARNTKFKEGQWSFIFYETKKPGNIIKLGRGETGNPSTYMGSDLKTKQTRWRFIEEEMIKNNIEKLTVKFCPIVDIK